VELSIEKRVEAGSPDTYLTPKSWVAGAIPAKAPTGHTQVNSRNIPRHHTDILDSSNRAVISPPDFVKIRNKKMISSESK
jgi:hypothetical protein